MELIQKQEFTDCAVQMDGKAFFRCTFTNVVLDAEQWARAGDVMERLIRIATEQQLEKAKEYILLMSELHSVDKDELILCHEDDIILRWMYIPPPPPDSLRYIPAWGSIQ